NVRVIAATHQHLEQHVKKGLFREDLFHRLNVIRIQLPALRERREDIPALLTLFLQRALTELASDNHDVLPKTIAQDAMSYLSSLHWPGNVRQLENTCQWLAVMTSGQTVHISDLPTELLTENQTTHNKMDIDWKQSLHRKVQQQLISGESEIASQIMADVEKVLINAALQKTNGRKNDAAKLLGWGRNTLTRKIKELALQGNAE
ncbi:MAG: nitrogen regulation protein NR(I), partial [Gammaproteobacteria bacterium]